MDQIINQIENAFVRKAVYQIVNALDRGQSPTATVAISVAIIVAVVIVKKITAKKLARSAPAE
jgi:hypothetical protein